jgi:uncharacterized protein YutE (UPF0331/DUF86 family)
MSGAHVPRLPIFRYDDFFSSLCSGNITAGGVMLDLAYRHMRRNKMPPSKKYQSIAVALTEADRTSFAKLANALGKTKGEVARDAIRWYMDNHHLISKSERDDRVSTEIAKSTNLIVGIIKISTNRICSLLVRAIIDLNMIMMMLFRMLPPEQADQIMEKMHRMAVSRVVRKATPDELNIARMIRQGLEQEISNEELPKAS